MDITSVQASFDKAVVACDSLKQLEELEVSYLGRNGKVNALLQSIKTVPNEQKKSFGSNVNALKQHIIAGIEQQRTNLFQKEDARSAIDVTLPGTPYPTGSLHITTYAKEEIGAIFERLGFIQVSYPELDWEQFAFEALNMPSDHPARDDFETFFIDAEPHKKYGKMVMTPHTSNGQNREMVRMKSTPPIRMINLGKCYRPNWDTSHVPMFHQFEGMCIDKDINITHLKGTIDHFAKQFFGESRTTRLRPFHFQFTEPSFEVDITCGVCDGTGVVQKQQCRMCKSGWLELGGSGMIHPNVLRAGGIDPTVYSGWAFGFGVERVYSMKEGLKLDDLRVIYGGDIRFLEQF